MSWYQIIEACCIIFGGSILQGAVGFGMGQFSIPILIWFGVPLEAAVAMILTASGCHAAWCSYRSHDSFDWRMPLPFAAIRMLTVPVGILALGVLSAGGEQTAKRLVGGIIIAILLSQWLFKVKPRAHLRAGWLWLAATTSGFLAGLLAMGGPPVVMWVMAHDWPTRQARAYLWMTFLMTAPLAIVLIWWRFGHPILIPLLVGAALTPFIIAGAAAGMWMGSFMSRMHLRIAMTTLLVIIAAASFVMH